MNLDFETYSEAGVRFDFREQKWKTANTDTGGNKKSISLVGGYAYASHPSTEVTVARYWLEGQEVKYWRPGLPNPEDLLEHVRAGGIVTAWNSPFEWSIWNFVCTRLYGWPALPLEL